MRNLRSPLLANQPRKRWLLLLPRQLLLLYPRHPKRQKDHLPSRPFWMICWRAKSAATKRLASFTGSSVFSQPLHRGAGLFIGEVILLATGNGRRLLDEKTLLLRPRFFSGGSMKP